MKIKKRLKFNKILNLKFFKNKIYDLKLQSNYLTKNLKSYLKIIFKYFLFNKKIVLISCLNLLNAIVFHLIKSTNFIYVPEKLWLNGLLSNSKIIFKFLVFSKNFSKLIQFLFNLQSDLILLFKNEISNNELLNFNLPILSFNNNHKKLFDYLLNLSHRKKVEHVFFYFLQTLLKKTKRLNYKYKFNCSK